MKTNDSRLALLDEITETKENKHLIQKYKNYVTSPKLNEYDEELYCICRKPDNGDLMVACDGCDEWFHFKCMNLNLKYEKLVSNFYCLFCDELFKKGKTLWKRKCRLEDCLNPIIVNVDNGTASKYCCKEHAKIYMEQNLLMKLGGEKSVSKEQFAKVLVQVSNYDEFIKLGETLPMTNLEKLPTNIQTEIKSLENQIAEIVETQSHLQFQKACLNNAKEKSKIINEEIFKLNNDDNDQDNKKKKRKRKDICGYDYSNNQTVEPLTCLEDLKISQQEFSEAYETSKSEQTTMIFQTCIKEKTKCFKHSYWYEIKLDNLQNLIIQNNEFKNELEQKIKNLIAMGWDFLENV